MGQRAELSPGDLQGLALGQQHLAHARDLRRRVGRGLGVLAQDDDVDVARHRFGDTHRHRTGLSEAALRGFVRAGPDRHDQQEQKDQPQNNPEHFLAARHMGVRPAPRIAGISAKLRCEIADGPLQWAFVGLFAAHRALDKGGALSPARGIGGPYIPDNKKVAAEFVEIVAKRRGYANVMSKDGARAPARCRMEPNEAK